MPQQIGLFDMLQNRQEIVSGGVLSSFTHTYEDIISIENLLSAWQEFIHGKRKKADVQEFGYNLMENIIALHTDLKEKAYRHGGYKHFKIADPKPRDIHKASVRDRLLHHAIYRVLYPDYDTQFIHDSYSCRNGKGTHKAIQQFQKYERKVSKNHTKTCYVLKCDIKKFFASINHSILIRILEKHIKDTDILWLLSRVIGSFEKGLPLGNLPSQLLVNIYMNEFDQNVKQTLKIKHHIRYADDFIILSRDRISLLKNLQSIGGFLEQKLKLSLHPKKVFLTTLSSGVDFLGWVHFPTHRVLRTSTKWRMFRRVGNVTTLDCHFVSTFSEEKVETNRKDGEGKISGDGTMRNSAVVQSYLGLLGWGNGWKLAEGIKHRHSSEPL